MGLLDKAIKVIAVKSAENVGLHAADAFGKYAENKIQNAQVITIPNNSEYYIEKNYQEVANVLRAYGFYNISFVEHKDLIKGWLVKDGSIEEISINGKTNFRKKAKFSSDSHIAIKYHTYKNRENSNANQYNYQPEQVNSQSFIPTSTPSLGINNNTISGCCSNQSSNSMQPPPVPTIAYHVAVNGQATGPYNMAALSQMVTSGAFTKDTLVWKPGMADWVKAESEQPLQVLFVNNNIPPVPPVK